MGKKAKILLVVGFIGILIGGCNFAPAFHSDTVRAQDHDAFFLWAGVEPGDSLANAQTVYLLSGEVRCGPSLRFESLRAEPNAGPDVGLWMVVRADCLVWDEAIEGRVMADLQRWSRRNTVLGLQIDYDSPTGELTQYAQFLKGLRARLPQIYRLSATGLLDWSSNGNPAALEKLGEAVDEIVVQTYRGRCTVPNYQSYVRSLTRLPFPYRVGLVQHGQWIPPDRLAQDEEFEGYVVFLVNDRAAGHPEMRSQCDPA